jgi:hypothetical protein
MLTAHIDEVGLCSTYLHAESVHLVAVRSAVCLRILFANLGDIFRFDHRDHVVNSRQIKLDM